MKGLKRVFSLILTVILITSMLAACKGKTVEKVEKVVDETQTVETI